ncbi:MAG: 3,4-dihydroxy 2-butanone 4-phosphate synthase [Phenylobacterium sp.]|jgi:3,4-dihydroxy 2-butanone 4-phosphate synthase
MNQSIPNQSILDQFGSPFTRVERAIKSLQQGNGVMLVDDENRENEGDLIYSTQHLTTAQMALMIRECSGIVCLCLSAQKTDQLQLPQMVDNNTSRNHTAYTVSIEAKDGVTTGVSAADRVHTVKTASAYQATADDLCRPGHVFPLQAHPGGVLERRGHTEGTLDLMALAGLQHSGILCELTNVDGSMARLPRIAEFATEHELPLLSIEDLVQYRQQVNVRAS